MDVIKLFFFLFWLSDNINDLLEKIIAQHIKVPQSKGGQTKYVTRTKQLHMYFEVANWEGTMPHSVRPLAHFVGLHLISTVI